MNENINLVEILKNVPKGTKLYSPLFGEVEFECITKNNSIYIYANTVPATFLSNGKYLDEYKDSECLLFPSKNQRDWSKFKYDPIKKGTPCMVQREGSDEWILRYYAGDDSVYMHGRKYGYTTSEYYKIIPVLEFDFYNKCRKSNYTNKETENIKNWAK